MSGIQEGVQEKRVQHGPGVCKQESRGAEAGWAQRPQGHLSGCVSGREGFPKPRVAPEGGRGVEGQRNWLGTDSCPGAESCFCTTCVLVREKCASAQGRGEPESAHWLRDWTGPWAWGARISGTPRGGCVCASGEVQRQEIPLCQEVVTQVSHAPPFFLPLSRFSLAVLHWKL